MTMTREFRRKVSVICAFGAPILLVKLTTVVSDTSWLQGALGSTDSAAFVIPDFSPTKGPEWSSAQRATEARIIELRNASFGPSPMYYTMVIEPGDEGDPDVVIVPTAPRVFTISVQVVMGSPQGVTALINNRMYRVGDLIRGSDWRITTMDAANRTVTVRHDLTGEEATHAVDLHR